MNNFITATLQPLLTALVTTVIPLLLVLICRWISKKTGIAISDSSQQKLEDIATKTVLYVEEKAAGSLKTAGEKWPSYLKYQQAIDRVLSLAPALTHEQADMLVHWALAKIPGVGATGVLGTAPAIAQTVPLRTDVAASDPAPVNSPADSFVDLLANLVSSKLSPVPVGGTDVGDIQSSGGAVAVVQ